MGEGLGIEGEEPLIQEHIFGGAAGALQDELRARLAEDRGGLVDQVTLAAPGADVDVGVAGVVLRRLGLGGGHRWIPGRCVARYSEDVRTMSIRRASGFKEDVGALLGGT